MIDITKFEGDTPGPWIATGPWVEHTDDKIPDICTADQDAMGQYGRSDAECRTNAAIIAAVTDLLAEVIRLRAEVAAMAWRPMEAAPKTGRAVLALLVGSDVAHAVRWLDADNPLAVNGAGWHISWDMSPIAAHDGPERWMPIPDAPQGGAA